MDPAVRKGRMEGSAAEAMSPDELLFHDGFGDRLLVRDNAGKPLYESLMLRSDLSAVPSFEFSLAQRLNSLKEFDHPWFVCIRELVRIPGRLPRLSLLADYCGGVRLTEVLAAMESQGAPRSPGVPLYIIQEILGAVATLHRQSIIFDWLSQHVGGSNIFEQYSVELQAEFRATVEASANRWTA